MSDGNLGPGYSDATLRQHEDPQTKANTEALESAKPDVRSNVRNAADPHSTAGIYNLTGGQYEIMSGVVLFAFPYLHVYKVQIDGMPATTAISASSGPLAPVGATDSSLFRAGANVLLAWPKNSNYPYIVGSVPYLSSTDKKNLASCLQAGSNIDITKTKGVLRNSH